MKRSRLVSKGKPCCGRSLCSCGKPSSLKRTPMNRTRTRLKGISDRRRREQAARRKVLRETFGERPACEVCGRPADDGHERKSRARGGSPTDPANIVALCRTHHEWAHANPEAAHAAGLLRHSWED